MQRGRIGLELLERPTTAQAVRLHLQVNSVRLGVVLDRGGGGNMMATDEGEFMKLSYRVCLLFVLMSWISLSLGQDGELADRAAITAQLDNIYALSLSKASADIMTSEQLQFFADQPTVVPPDQEPLAGRAAVTSFYQ
jgi:hypothetical protein